jgi:JAB domain-containing protein similar to deubiquitination enzymes
VSVEAQLLEAAARGDEARFVRLARSVGGLDRAQEIVRSATSVARVGSPGGQTRSMPEQVIDDEGPPSSRAGRRTPRSIRTSVGPRRVVEFSEYAWRDLREEVMEFDGFEFGGGLFGQVGADGTVLVERICGPTDWTERSTHGITIERDRMLAIERALPDSWHWVGDWHTHDEPITRPSEPDFRGWAAAVRSALGVYVGVIATPDPRDDWRFDNPTFAAWIVRAGELPRPATIERTTTWH